MNNFITDQLSKELCSFVADYLKEGGDISFDPVSWKRLPGDGSDRILYRIEGDGKSLILVTNENPPENGQGVNENDSFDYICRHLREQGIATPMIYRYSREKGWFLLEDLGEAHFHDHALKLKNNPPELIILYKKALKILPIIQVKGSYGFDQKRVLNSPYNLPFILQWESGYFFRSFIKDYLKLDVSREEMKNDLDDLAEKTSRIAESFFLYYDFQSKNIMVQDGNLRFIDFQGGRLGPLAYDLASLIYDPYVDIDEAMRQELTTYYLEQLSHFIPLDQEKFLQEYPYVAVHRIMQMLGAFGFLSTVKKKLYFSDYIPAAVVNLKQILGLDQFAPYQNLRRMVQRL